MKLNFNTSWKQRLQLLFVVVIVAGVCAFLFKGVSDSPTEEQSPDSIAQVATGDPQPASHIEEATSEDTAKAASLAVVVPDESTLVVERDDSGNKSGEGHKLNGIKVGTWTFYHPNGKPRCRGEFVDDQPTGRWRFYHTNGKIRSQGNRLDGRRIGGWAFFHSTGDLMSRGKFDSQGQKTGKWTTYHTNGMKKMEGDFREGLPFGLWRGYPYDDQTSYWEGHFDDQGRKSGTWTWFKQGSRHTIDVYEEGERIRRTQAQ